MHYVPWCDVIGFGCMFLAFVYGIRPSQPYGLKYCRKLIWRLGGLGQGRQIYFLQCIAHSWLYSRSYRLVRLGRSYMVEMWTFSYAFLATR